jgi:hypothetical protein
VEYYQQTADLLLTSIIVAACVGSVATVWAWAQSGVVWPWSKSRRAIDGGDLASITQAVERLTDRLEDMQEELGSMHDRLEFTERLLERPRDAKAGEREGPPAP